MAIYWSIRNQPGYTPWTNGAWSSFMNGYAAHPFDSNATDPNIVNAVFASGSTIVYAPYSGTYELRGAADNFGAIDLGGQNTIISGFTHSGISVYKYYNAGQAIGIAWNFSNAPANGSFVSNPCAAAIILIGPDKPPPPTASIYAVPNPIYKGQSSTVYYSSSGATSTNYGPTSGSFSVSPDASTTYSVTATNAGGSTTASTTLNVLINPPTVTLTGTETSVIQGESLDLTWSATVEQNDLESASLTDVLLTATNRFGGTTTVTPNSTNSSQWTKRYTYSATNPSGTSSANWDVTVYIPPVLTLSVDDTTRILGQSTNLRWTYTGDASSIQWTKPEVDPPTNNNLSGSPESVSPTVTTTYCAVATGLGGTSPEDCVTVTVYQPPYIEDFYTPSGIQYNASSFNITYETYYANTELKLEIFETGYESGPNIGSTLLYDTITLTPASSAEAGDTVNGEATRDINNPVVVDISSIWNQHGPRTIMVRLSGSGDGGNFVQENNIAVTIDETPDNITIPESEDLLKDADPVISPDTEILTDQIFIDDIDIPVEVLADEPVQVNKNANGTWTNVRSIGSGLPVGGSSLPEEESFELRSMNVPDEDPPTFDVETNAASATFSFSGGVTSVAIIQGGSVTYSWSVSGGYSSVTLNGVAQTASGTANTYKVRNVTRWFSTTPAPGDHMCALSNPGGYTAEFVLFKAFTTQAPGTFGAYDQEAPGTKPVSGLLGYVYPSTASSTPVTTTTIYEKIDPNGGPPTGFGTIWTTSSSGEGPYTSNGPNGSFKTPTAGYTDYSGLSWSGTSTVTPTSTTSYKLVASGGGLTTKTITITVTVYVPPTISFTSSQGNTIAAGQSTIISWTVSGDASSISWTSGDITNTNLDSNSTVSPNDTTTYCAVASGLGGKSSETCITITVYQIPTGSLTVPEAVNYTEDFNIEYETQYANSSISITPTYRYLNGTSVTGTTINRTAATGDQLSDPDSATVRSGTIPITVPWNNFGPSQVDFTLTAEGSGGSTNVIATTSVSIDQTPDNFTIEESDDLLKDTDPVYTPDTEILSQMYLINDIDIPVEVKSDWPIKIDVNRSMEWENIRQIGSGLPGGSSVPTEPEGSSFPTEPGVYHIKPSSIPSEPPLIAKTQALTEEDYAKLVTCVSVIDETGGSAYNDQGFLNNVWEQSPAIIGAGYNSRGFRTAFPYRTFYILDPGGPNNIDTPTNYASDPNAFGPIGVNRDGGNASNRSDWFDVCNFGTLPFGTIVSIWIDISGSMTLATVQASYDYFLTRCAAAGIEIVLSLSASGERYIEEHIQYLPPSANFTALYVDSDGNNITENILIVAGETVTLSWVVFGDVDNMNVNQGVQPSTSNFANYVKSVDVTPSEETTYILTVNGPAGTTTRLITIDVLVPPTLNLTADDYDLIAGGCTNLRWDFTGDATSISWTSGAVDNGNLESFERVCLDDTTTFCAILDGPAGQSPETCVTINVSQPPTAEITVPAQTDYGVNFNIDYTTQYANDSIVITVTYLYLNGTTTSSTINRTAANSAELGDLDSETIASGEGVPINVIWNDFGPYQITFSMAATGTGGLASASGTTSVNIDETPDAFAIEESDDVLKDADPVYTPDTEILSEMYLINDIDIPVEIKSDWPIKVDKNANDDWENVRPI